MKILSILTIALFSLGLEAKSDVTLPRIFSNNMVLQREMPITVWGWAGKSESITVMFNGATVKAKAGKDGSWKAVLNAMKPGGPYTLTVKGESNTITLSNILIGDIWIGSGQSNMEWIVKNSNNASGEIAAGNHPQIRLFTVEKAMSFYPEKDVAGGEWLECTPETLGDFSAVAYFFGRKLNQDLNIPIGLVNSSWGGTNIQTWMSWDVMSQKEEYKSLDLAALHEAAKDFAVKKQRFDAAMENERGKEERWYDPQNASDWKAIMLPRVWEQTEIGNADGYIWFRKEFEVGAEAAGKPAVVHLGPIDDSEETYLNGKLIGSTQGWNIERNYTLTTGMLQPGRNVLVVRVLDTGGGGGIYGTKEQVFVETEGRKIPLAGEWQYKPSVVSTEFGMDRSGPNMYPSQLYNAMIAPLTPLAIKGVIWYQGEANTGEPQRYRKLFPEMITDWRTQWKQQFPFFWVQLANFMAPDSVPSSSGWAMLREAQSMTLSLPSTGQAVTIDIGEEKDIHPRNKQDVGLRLAFSALNVAYQKKNVSSGPAYQSMEKTGDKIVLTFTHTGSGLMVKDKYGYLKAFAIAGADRKFVWARAYIENGKVVVYHPSVKDPVAVRYAWGDNPDDANLYNKEGLPASPFRTDTWEE
jgi:sialate O-acetylesterase